MNKEQLNKPNAGLLSGNAALPQETQLRLAESKRKLAIARYKLGVRSGSAWFRPPVPARAKGKPKVN